MVERFLEFLLVRSCTSFRLASIYPGIMYAKGVERLLELGYCLWWVISARCFWENLFSPFARSMYFLTSSASLALLGARGCGDIKMRCSGKGGRMSLHGSESLFEDRVIVWERFPGLFTGVFRNGGGFACAAMRRHNAIIRGG